MDTKKRNLDARDWLHAGLKLLKTHGHNGIKLPRLLNELGVSSGSFYWHFKNVAAYRSSLLRFWSDEYVPSLPKRARQSAASPDKYFEELSRIILQEQSHRIDDAIRDWAEDNAEARSALKKADSFRRDEMKKMSRERGADKELRAEDGALLEAVWRGTAGMTNAAERLKLAAMVTDPEKKR